MTTSIRHAITQGLAYIAATTAITVVYVLAATQIGITGPVWALVVMNLLTFMGVINLAKSVAQRRSPF